MLALLLSALSVFGISPQKPAETPDIHFAVTPQPLADAMLTLAHVTKNDVVYDLGSGDGRIVVLAAQKYGAHAVGIEIDHTLIEISRTVAREGEVADRATFIEGDLFTADLSKATVVTLWLSTSVNLRLEAKLKRELKSGRAHRLAAVSDRRVGAGSDGPRRRRDPAALDDPVTVTPARAGRALLLLLLARWTWLFIVWPMREDTIGASFLHLISLPFHEAGTSSSRRSAS